MNKPARHTLLLATLFLALSAVGQAAWVNLGPSPPAIEGPIAFDAATGTVYIGTFGGGVLKSTDRGATFVPVNDGLTSLAIAYLAMDRRDPNHLVAGTGGNGSFRTTDGGASWSATSEVSGLVSVLAFDPNDSNVIYAGYAVGNTAAIKKSVDGGAHWAKADSGIPPGTTVWSIVPDPRDGNTVYIGTASFGALKTTDGGASWARMPLPPVVWALAVDPQDPDVVYAGVNGEGVFKSTDAGATFERVGSPQFGVVLALIVDPRDSRRIYAGTVSAGIEVSVDGGVTWNRTAVSDAIVPSLSITDDGTVYAGSAFNGAFVARTRPGRIPGGRQAGGQPGSVVPGSLRQGTFTPLAVNELHAINAQNVVSVTVDPLDSAHILLGTNDGGLIGSADGGVTWHEAGKGLLNRSPRNVLYDPRVKGRLWCGSFEGGGLYQSDDNGGHWVRHLFGSPTIYVWKVVIDARNGAIYATTKGEGVWRSTDDGATFSRIDSSLVPQARWVAFDPQTPDRILIASLGGIWRSVDGGAHFTKVAPQLAITVTYDAEDPQVVYASTQTTGVMKSVDGGATFVESNRGLTSLRMGRLSPILIDPRNHSTLFAATETAGVFKSIDAGASWAPFNAGLTQLSVAGITMDPSDPNVLYVGGPSGVFRTNTGGE